MTNNINHGVSQPTETHTAELYGEITDLAVRAGEVGTCTAFDDASLPEPDHNLRNQDLAKLPMLPAGNPELRPMAERYDLATVKALCASPAAREFIFRSIDEQRQGLMPTYQLTHFLVEEHESIAEPPDRPIFDELSASVASQPGRQRAAKKSNLPLLAVNFMARPTTVGERAQCSDLACLLEFALDEGIAPEDYPDWVTTVTLEHALEVIRAKRSAEKGKTRRKRPKAVPLNAVELIPDVLRGAMAANEGLVGDVVVENPAGITLSIAIKEGDRLIREHADFVTGPTSATIVGILAEGFRRNMIEVLCEILDLLQESQPPPAD